MDRHEATKQWYDKRFPYYGDLWLVQHDILSKMTLEETLQLAITRNILLLPLNEIAYQDGSKLSLTNQVAFTSGINRLLKQDPEKYKEILSKRKGITIIDFDKMMKDQEAKQESYIG